MYSILQLIEKHGFEAERHLFRCLFSFIDFAGDGKNNGKDFLQVSRYAVGWYMTVLTQKSATLERTETEDHKNLKNASSLFRANIVLQPVNDSFA